MSDWLNSLVPEKPIKRVVSLAALAAAGCGGIYLCSQSGLLEGSESFPLKPWQVLTLASWVGNTVAVNAGGRIDSRNKDGSKKEDLDLPATRFFSPAGWAFAIWGPIISGETGLALYQGLPLSTVRLSFGWLSKLSPWLASGYLFQVLAMQNLSYTGEAYSLVTEDRMGTTKSCWCLSFRRWAKNSGLFWFPAVLLGCTAVSFGGAHKVLRTALANGDMSSLQYSIVHIPISLHYAWVSCAALVNANGYLSLLPSLSEKTRLRFSLASITAATYLAVAVTCTSGDPLYAGVVTWALAAIAGESAKKSNKGAAEESSLKSEKTAARVGAVACAITTLIGSFVSNMP